MNSRISAPQKGPNLAASASAGVKAQGSGKPPARGTRGSRRAAAAGRSPDTKAGRCLSRGGSRSVGSSTSAAGEEMSIVNVKELNRFEAGSVVDTEALRREGLVKGSAGGRQAARKRRDHPETQREGRPGSKAAVQKVVAAGGTVEVYPVARRLPEHNAGPRAQAARFSLTGLLLTSSTASGSTSPRRGSTTLRSRRCSTHRREPSSA